MSNGILSPWRRYLRFSMRGLIVAVLLIGGWLGWIIRGARIQREAAAAIVRSGGFVDYEWDWKDGCLVQGGRPQAPDWLVDALGHDYFGQVVRVFYYENRASDAVIAHIRRFPDLVHLGLMGPNVTDAGVSRLTLLKQISSLGLSNAHVSDTGLAGLAGLTSLEELTLDGTDITDAGLANLKALKKLSYLSLRKTEVSDAGASPPQGLANLRLLDLEGTRVTEAGITELAQAMPELVIEQ